MADTQSSSGANGSAEAHTDSHKRKAEDSPSAANAKKGKTSGEQQTLEQTIKNGQHNGAENGAEDTGIKAGDSFKGGNKDGEAKDDPEKALKDSRDGRVVNDSEGASKEGRAPHDDNHAADESALKTEVASGNAEETKQVSEESTGGAIEEDKDREEALPSNILEKGVIYFFTRGRVGIEEIESVQDLQRSYFVLRPIPDGAKIGDGAINDLKNNRLFALPKKVWPKSSKDRFMAFVEKAQTTIQDLKENFFEGSEYVTKTTGTRQTPPVTPVGEGVYAITSTGNRGESHLVYMLTIPQEPGKVQEETGIASKGSFLMSLKNPEVKGPANASLPQKPDWPKEFIDEFRNRSWMPAEPKHLDYANAQILLIGENFESGHAVEQTKSDEKDPKKESPEEELEKLENEDEIRIKHLKGDDTIYEDLGISKKDYPNVATTW